MTRQFTYPVDLPGLAKSGERLKLSASPGERRALAARFGVPEIRDFTASLAAKKQAPGIYRLEGHIGASLVQASVRTLKPVKSAIDERFSVIFMRPEIFDAQAPGEDEGAIEDIEILGDEAVDVGEIAAQYLSLFIDPYPAGEGESLPAAPGGEVRVYSEDGDPEKPSPFAGLKNLENKG